MGARASAMADAYTADIYDIAVLYWNPASLSFLEKKSVMLDHFYEWKTAVMNDVVAVPIPLKGQQSLGLGASVSHLGYLRNHRPYHARAIQYGFDLGYARILSTGFSGGIRVGGRYSHSENSDFFTSSWSLGITYYPSPGISYGLVLGDIGEDVSTLNGGTLTKQASLRRLQVGITMRYPLSLQRRLLTLALTNEKIFGETGLYYRLGFEVNPFEFAALRVGYFVGPLTAAARYGLGFKTDLFQVDYAIAPSTHSFRFQQLSLSILLR